MQRKQRALLIYFQLSLLFQGLYQSSSRKKVQYLNETFTATLDSLEIFSSDTSSIYTKGCMIPNLELMDTSVRHLVQYPTNSYKCYNKFPLLESNDTQLWVNKENIRHYSAPDDGILRCCYAPITITLVNEETKLDYHKCVMFNESIRIADEFVRVTCNVWYEQYFVFALKKPFTALRENPFETPDNQTAFNVMILGLSSMSRLNFHRSMPNTLKLLKQKGVIEFMGYNKVGSRGILTEVLAMLVGMDLKQLQRTCWPHPKSTIHRCPFIWERFKDAGYYTAFLEDSAIYSTFHISKMDYNVMKNIPTDYFLTPIIGEVEKLNRNRRSIPCMDNKFYYKAILDYLESLTTTLKSHKLFSIFWESSMTHLNFNNAMLLDHDYEDFVRKLDRSGYLNNTILIFLSDQGFKYGKIHKTKQGRLEELLPSLFILTPPTFAQEYNFAYENLQQNSRRFITHYDVHDTLIDLIDLNAIKNEEVLLRSQIAREVPGRSISLFLEVPSSRTCNDTGLEDVICPCVRNKMMTDGVMVREASEYLVQYLNEILNSYPQCAKLKLETVVKAIEQLVRFKEEVPKKSSWRDVMVTVRVAPGDGVFTATVRRSGNSWSLASNVKRINAHNDQSTCVPNYQTKMFCYCEEHKKI